MRAADLNRGGRSVDGTCDYREIRVRRTLLASIGACALALGGCGVVKDAAQRAAEHVPGLGDRKEAADAAQPSKAKPGAGLSIAADEHATDAVAADDDADEGTPGFYKIVEPNGTVRFTSNLSEVPVDQRPKAERLAMAPSKPSARTAAAPKPRGDSKQIGVADEKQPPAARAPKPNGAP